MLLLIGIVGGILSGLFGVGGGSIYIPALVLLLQYTQQSAQGISLLVMIPTAALGLSIYIKHKYVRTDLLLPLIIFGVIGVIAGSYTAHLLPTKILSKLFAVLLLISGFKLLRDN